VDNVDNSVTGLGWLSLVSVSLAGLLGWLSVPACLVSWALVSCSLVALYGSGALGGFSGWLLRLAIYLTALNVPDRLRGFYGFAGF